MDIKLPGIRLIAPKTYSDVAERIIKQYLFICFWLSWLIPFGAYHVFEILKAKGWLG